MKKTYLIFKALLVLLVVLSTNIRAQNCISTSQYPSGTNQIASTGTTNVSLSCNWGGEYSVNNFTTAGTYTVTSTGGTGNYITVTDNSNNAVTAGNAPLAVAIPSVGVYRIHVSTSSSCGTDATCHDVAVVRILAPCTQTVQNPPSSTVTLLGSGTTMINSCNFGGEFAAISATVAGVYTFSASGGAYLTLTTAGNIPVSSSASNFSVLSISVPSVGVYNLHVSANGTCGIDATCHTVTAVGPLPGNDICANAYALAIPSTTAGTTVGATTESPAPGTCGTSLSQPGVWYTVVGNGNRLGASLCGTSWDSKIWVYSGSCGAWTCIAGIDDNGPLCSGTPASAAWCSVPSTTYYILVTGFSSANAFNLAITQTVVVAPTPTATASSPSVCPSQTTTLTGSGASTYSWSTGSTATSLTVAPSTATTYTLIGRDATGCSAVSTTVLVSIKPQPTVSVNSGSICPGQVFTMTASGASSYTFTGGSTTITSSGSGTVSPIVTTNYSVSGTGTNACVSASAAVSNVVMLQTPTVTTASSPSVLCAGSAATITASGANTYTWNGSTVSNSIVVSPGTTTQYTVAGTGTTICNAIKVHTVTVSQLPTVTVNSGTLCEGNTFSIVPSGATTYSYSGGSNTVNPVASTSYSVTGYNTFGCASASAAVSNVTVILKPIVTLSSGTICAGTPFTIQQSGANTYTMTGGSNPVSPSVTSSYTVTGTSSVGCISLPVVTTITVFAVPQLTITIAPSTTVCSGDPVNLSVAGGATYTWNAATSGSTFSAAPSTSTVYFVYGTDSIGCTNFTTQPITVNPLPNVGVTNNNTFVCSGAPAILVATGAPNYSWTNGGNTGTITINPTVTTVYGVTGTSSLGCTKTVTTAITVNTIVLTLSSNTAICDGQSTELTATGVNSYTWSHNPNLHFAQVTVNPSVTTTYNFSGKDTKNCLHTGAVTVTVNPLPNITVTASHDTICTGESADFTASGASSYTWGTQGAGASMTVTPTFATTYNYSVSATDSKGCVNTKVVTLVASKCTGIYESATIAGFKVYPNPNNGEFVIELSNGKEKTIEVTDVSGRVLVSEKTNRDALNVNINNYSNGVYYVKITSDKNVEVVKIIKQ
jgi:hypothetical protein